MRLRIERKIHDEVVLQIHVKAGISDSELSEMLAEVSANLQREANQGKHHGANATI